MTFLLPQLLLGIALLCFPRGWMQKVVTFLRRRRKKSGVERRKDPWKGREPGSQAVHFGTEFTKVRNYLDLLRAAAGSIAIYQLPEANALSVATLVEKKMQELKKAFPPGLDYSVPFNTTMFVHASIQEVFMTLLEAGLLVLIVIVIFLQDWRAMLVPATTIPVTIIGAFAAMAALGFTINLSTMFGIVLAIGIVVDDAIVIVEGVARHIERGMSSHDAAIKAMDELFGPVIGITLVLMSVFIPAAFVPGLTGKMFAQFALVIAATAFISAVNAATLKPTQCAMWLRPAVPPEKRNAFFRGFNAVYSRMEGAYSRLIGAMVSRSGAMVLVALAIAGLVAAGRITRVVVEEARFLARAAGSA